MSSRLVKILIVVLLLGAAIFLTLNPRTIFKRSYFTHPLLSDLIFNLQKTRKSFLNIADLLYFPHWFKDSNLETFEIFVSAGDLSRMNEVLPSDYFDGRLKEENQVLVPAKFKAGDYEADVKIRYRGFISNHWNREQRSYQVRFPEDNLFRGHAKLDLIIPWDRQYFVEPLNMYRANKIGLPMQEISFTRLVMNGRDAGVYLTQERLGQEWIEYNGASLPDATIFATDFIGGAIEDLERINLFSLNGRLSWKKFNQLEDATYEELYFMSSLIDNADNDQLERYLEDVFDMESIYAVLTLNQLAGNHHSLVSLNPNVIFDTSIGKFKLIANDVGLAPPAGRFVGFYQGLTERILSVPKFFEQFQQYFAGHVSDDKNLEDDLAFYDGLYEKYKGEFYRDRGKWDSSYVFDKKVAQYRAWIVGNFEDAKILATLNADSEEFGLNSEDLDRDEDIRFEGSFKYFPLISQSTDQFVRNYPQFFKTNARTVVLGPGQFYFSNNVIVPKGITLTIQPGTSVSFGPGASLVSYSPIIARGSAATPIRFTGNSWGAVGVINAHGKSIFSNTIFTGGSSSEEINGLVFTGMLSIRNSAADILNSTFLNDRDDDALHLVKAKGIVRNNRFINNNGDALDISLSNDIKILNNYFNKNGFGLNFYINGDAINLSFSSGSVMNNIIDECGDTGINISENSNFVVSGNKVVRCQKGISIADNSYSEMDNNVAVANNIGLESVLIKQFFINGGTASVSSSIFWQNEKEIIVDNTSSIKIEDSVVEEGYVGGINISHDEPDLTRALPYYVKIK
jgi:hypothetical protein